MRRVIVPALLAFALVASTSANANAFGLFGKLCNSGCDSCCAEPACGCEAACEPACGCEVACEPACGCEVDPCCDPCGKRGGLLKKLFSRRGNCGCDSCCAEPACGCEAACEPACGCEAACEPACGCEAACAPACGCEVATCCDPCDPCCKPKRKPFGLLKKLFSCNKGCGCDACDSCCAEPACGCEAPCEPACGCEVAGCCN